MLPALLLLFALAGCAGTALRYPDPVEPTAPPLEVVHRLDDRPNIALVLGSGGTRGFAHIGVIKALEAAGIDCRIVVGSSAGAVVGAFYAAGLLAADIEREAHAIAAGNFFDLTWPHRGFVRGELLQEYVNSALGNRLLENLPRKFAAVATDVVDGRLTAFTHGNVGLAVRASSSIPAVFRPTVIGGREYVDGDLASPLPVRVAREMGADIVIAVDIARVPEGNTPTSAMSMMFQTLKIMRRGLVEREAGEADFVLRPIQGRPKAIDFSQRDGLISAGEATVASVLPAIHERIAAVTAKNRLAKANSLVNRSSSSSGGIGGSAGGGLLLRPIIATPARP